MSLTSFLSYSSYLPLCALRLPQCPAPKASAASPSHKRGRRDGMSLGDTLGGHQAQQGNQGEESQHGRGIAWQGNCCGSSGSRRRHGGRAGKQERGCSRGRREGVRKRLMLAPGRSPCVCHDKMWGRRGNKTSRSQAKRASRQRLQANTTTLVHVPWP